MGELDNCMKIFGFAHSMETVNVNPDAIYAFCYYDLNKSEWVSYAGSFPFVFGVYTGIYNGYDNFLVDHTLSCVFFELNADGTPKCIVPHACITSCAGINWFLPNPRRYGVGIYRDLIQIDVNDDGEPLVPPLIWQEL